MVYVQARLFGEPIVLDEGHDLERCDIRCLRAGGHICRCRCHGKNHGLMRKRRNTTLDDSKLYFSLSHDLEIRRLFDGKRCLNCGETLDYAEILAYEHEGGIYYEPYKMKLWVFAECPRCQYQNSFMKFLGR